MRVFLVACAPPCVPICNDHGRTAATAAGPFVQHPSACAHPCGSTRVAAGFRVVWLSSSCCEWWPGTPLFAASLLWLLSACCAPADAPCAAPLLPCNVSCLVLAGTMRAAQGTSPRPPSPCTNPLQTPRCRSHRSHRSHHTTRCHLPLLIDCEDLADMLLCRALEVTSLQTTHLCAACSPTANALALAEHGIACSNSW